MAMGLLAFHENNKGRLEPGVGILMHSRTVVEKSDYVTTGVLSYAEGDILEIEMSDVKSFGLGDHVKLTIYSPGGIYMMSSTVVAKDHNALMLINPPSNRSRFAEKRQHPRVPVSETGRLTSILGADGEPLSSYEDMILTIENISVSGVGFTLAESDIELAKETVVTLELELGSLIDCKAEIVRNESSGDGLLYLGAQFVEIEGSKINSLRAFVLKKQVEVHYSRKRDEDDRKRVYR
jgi:c-di-GMP-binding flagellar brake protein YcgR